MLKAVALFVLLALVGGISAQDYCSLCTNHTMCIYKSPGPDCKPLTKSGVNDKERQQIVDVHNELRSKVASGQQGGQPSSSNMRQMTYDDELAKVAQLWADQCDFGHDQCRTVPRFGVGQNAYMTGSTASGATPDWRNAIQGWYSEVKDFNRNNISPFKFTQQTGHYTQVAWAESYKVGCGFAQFPKDGWIWLYYVCNYGPAGNVIGGQMYKEGKPCTQCRPGTTLCVNNLCV